MRASPSELLKPDPLVVLLDLGLSNLCGWNSLTFLALLPEYFLPDKLLVEYAYVSVATRA